MLLHNWGWSYVKLWYLTAFGQTESRLSSDDLRLFGFKCEFVRLYLIKTFNQLKSNELTLGTGGSFDEFPYSKKTLIGKLTAFKHFRD